MSLSHEPWKIDESQLALAAALGVPPHDNDVRDPVIGFHPATGGRRSNKILPITRCELITEDMNSLLACVRSAIKGFPELADELSEVLIRSGTERTQSLMVNFRLHKDGRENEYGYVRDVALPQPFVDALLASIPSELKLQFAVCQFYPNR